MYDDNERLIRQYQEGHKEVLGVIVENNQGLIHTALKSFKWAYNKHPKYDEIINYDDFFQEGVFGLCNAIEKYDPELGAFSTYAILRIKQKIYRFYHDNSRVIRVPYEPRKAYMGLRRAEEEYIKEYGHEPSTKELSVYSGVSFEEILELRRTFSNTISIDSPVGSIEDDSVTVGDSIPDNTDYLEGIERDMTIKALRRDLERMAKTVLKDDERVKMLFYYFDNLDKMQVNEISEACGIARGSLNRIINESVGKISRRYLDELIEGYMDLFSSNVRRLREIELYRTQVKNAIKTVAAKTIEAGDSITVITGASKDGLKKAVQVTVREVDDTGIVVAFVGYDYLKRSYDELERHIAYRSIMDFRTENKKIVEIVSMRGLL
ncbi:sigma-70 family RNA polymerase sigma factor [Proteiniclasticum sp. C24MP]|uniref:sigma-70 family RNA polymerase sigma factor n=1 Tax=Proteiniclasticum sp. C24MP TaxID=3374101 RepID=UPI0037545760